MYSFEAACVPLMVPQHHSLCIPDLKLITSVREIRGREPGVTTRHHNTT